MAHRAKRPRPHVRADRAAARRARDRGQLRRAVHRDTRRRGIPTAAGARRRPGVRGVPRARVGEPGLRGAARRVDRLFPGIGCVRQPVAGVADGRRSVATRAEHGAMDVHGLHRERARPSGIDGCRRAGPGMAWGLPVDRGAHGTGHRCGAPDPTRAGGGRRRPGRRVFRSRHANRDIGAAAVRGGQVARAAAGVRPDVRHTQGLPGAVHGGRGRCIRVERGAHDRGVARRGPGRRLPADTAARPCPRPDLPPVQRGGRPAAVSNVPPRSVVRAEAGRHRPAGVRERGLVLDPSRASLLFDAGPERHDRGARQRLRTRGLPGPTRAGRLRRQMGTRHGHVAALRRAGAALHRHCANRAQQHCAFTPSSAAASA